MLKSGQVSIKISKPRLTIDGFKIDNKDVDKKKDEAKRRVSSSTMKSKTRQYSMMIGAGLESLENKENNMNRENVNEAQDVNEQMYEEYSPEEDMNRDDEYDQESNNFDPMDQDFQGEGAEQFPVDQELNQENERDKYDPLPADQRRNPKNYAFMPSYMTRKIEPAGWITFRSESVFNILSGAQKVQKGEEDFIAAVWAEN